MSRYKVLAQERKNCYNAYMTMLDPIMKRFRADLDKIYGDRLDRVVLFGSRARGDARPDSDYDVAVFLNQYRSIDQELDILVDVGNEIMYDTGAIINAMPFRLGEYQTPYGLMRNVRNEGVDV
jgi:hypothetical protein